MTNTADQTRTFVIPHPGIDDTYPDMPEGVSDWERQEIQRCWRNAMTYGRDVMAGIEHDLNVRVPDGRPFANDAQRMAQYIAARSELAARIDAVEHRKALTERALTTDENVIWHGVGHPAWPDPLRLTGRQHAMQWLDAAHAEGHAGAKLHRDIVNRTVITTPEAD